MNKLLIFSLSLILPNILLAQTDAQKNILARIESECKDIVFTKAETLPTFKVPAQAYADSITSYLKERRVRLKSQSVTFEMIVTSQSSLMDIKKISGDVSKQKAFEEAISKYANLWVPAQQNGRSVCSYVKLDLFVNEGQLDVKVWQ